MRSASEDAVEPTKRDSRQCARHIQHFGRRRRGIVDQPAQRADGDEQADDSNAEKGAPEDIRNQLVAILRGEDTSCPNRPYPEQRGKDGEADECGIH